MRKKTKVNVKTKVLISFAVLVISVLTLRVLGDWINRALYPIKYEEYVTEYCEEYGVDEVLVYAVIRTESGFSKDAVSSVGARGLMQLTEETYDWVKVKLSDGREHSFDDMFEPKLNIQYGVYLLKLLGEDFEERDTVLAAYHAGRSKVLEWLNDPEYSKDQKNLDVISYKDTESYVKKVSHAYDIYNKIYDRD